MTRTSNLAGRSCVQAAAFAATADLSARSWTDERRRWCDLPPPAHRIDLVEVAQGRSDASPPSRAFIEKKLALELPEQQRLR